MSAAADGKKWLIVGRSGAGKTTLVRAMLREYQSRGYPIIIVQGHPGQLQDFGPVSIVTQERAERKLDWHKLLDDHPAIRFSMAAYDADYFFDSLAGALLDRGNLVLVLDDQQGYLTANPPRNMARIYMEGRYRRIHLMTVTQRLGNTSNTGTSMHARANVDHLVAFQVGDNTDLGRLQPLLPNCKSILPALPTPGGYVWRDQATGRTVVHKPGQRAEVITT